MEIDFKRLEAQAQREVARFAFSLRQRLVLNRVIEYSFGWGRLVVRFDRQSWLCRVTGLAETHLSVVVNELVALRVLQRSEATDGAVVLRVLVDAGLWGSRLEPIIDREYLQRLEGELRAFNGVEQLVLAAPVGAGLDFAGAFADAGCERLAAGDGRLVTDSVSGGGGYRIGNGETLKDLKKEDLSNPLKVKGSNLKGFMETEELREALLSVELGGEPEAVDGMRGILGALVMDGGDDDGRGGLRLGDGGKWRNRWKIQRRRVHRVMASLVEELKEGRVKSRGARAELIWIEFTYAPHKESI